MFSSFKLSSLLALLAVSNSITTTTVVAQHAGPVFTLRTPTLLGSGCPMGTARAELTGDGQAISILFSEFQASTNSDLNRDRKSCNFVLPVDAMPGVAIGFYKVDFRGYAYVPPVNGSYASITNEYFFAGQSGPTVVKRFDAGADTPIYESNSINVQSVIWSPCGGSTNFRINSAVIAFKTKTDEPTEDVQIQVDSVDATVGAEVQVFVAYQPCTPAPTPAATTTAPTTNAPTPAATTLAPTPSTVSPTLATTTVTPVPSTATPVPSTVPPTPATTTVTPVPSTVTPVPSTVWPTPATTTVTPVPSTATPVPSTVSPTPATTTVTPVPSTVTPVPSTVTPVPSTATPVPSTVTPAPTPVPSTAAPVPSTASPVASPTPTTASPAMTSISPSSSTAAPAPSASATATATAAP